MANKLEQAARQLLEVAVGIQHGTDWNNGTHAKIYRPKFPEAITALQEALSEQGCSFCNNPLFAGTSCPNCGRAVEPDHFAASVNKVPDHIAKGGKLILAIEQAQQIEEALSGWIGSLDEQAVVKIDEALAIIRAARAQDLLTIEAAEKMGATGAEPTETERQMFEAWMKGHCWAVCGKWDGKQYVGTDAYDDLHPYVMHTRGLWAAWRDRAALAAPQPVSQEQEPVAWMVTSEGLDGTPKTYPLTGRFKDVCDMCDFGDPIPLYAAQQPVQQAEQEQAEQEPVAWKCYRHDGTHYYLEHDPTEVEKYHGFQPSAPLYAAPVQQAEQEPVAIADGTFNHNCPLGTPLYTAQVRTKDLTDDEIADVFRAIHMKESWSLDFARAVIAKFKEKNK